MTEHKTIPLVQPTVAPWSEVAADLEAAWNNPQVTVGQNGARFEAAICERLGVDNAVMVSSCTAGLMIGLQALDLSGEVIIPPFTWTSTGLALLWNGLTPVLADITPGRYTLDPESVEAAITEKTTAIMPVTVFGTPPDVDALADIAEKMVKDWFQIIFCPRIMSLLCGRCQKHRAADEKEARRIDHDELWLKKPKRGPPAHCS